MRGVCAWCGKELELVPPSPVRGVTHGMCDECFLRLRVEETVKRLRPGPGPYKLFVPSHREDLLFRLWRESPPGCFLVFKTDRRRRERRAQRIPVPAERRSGRDRRAGNLSFLCARRAA